MIRLTFLLTFTTLLTWGQTPQDYKLYSIVLDDHIDHWDNDRDTITRTIVIEKFIPLENHVSWYGKDFLNSTDEIINVTVHYDTTLIKLVKNEKITDGIIKLESEYFDTPTLSASQFNLKTPVTTITDKRYHKYFKTIFGNKTERGWKKFYKKNPDVLGVYEFSKVVYSDNYALLYVGHHARGLFGSGNLVILKRENNDWTILSYLNIWMS